jgi:hypothetical protein
MEDGRSKMEESRLDQLIFLHLLSSIFHPRFYGEDGGRTIYDGTKALQFDAIPPSSILHFPSSFFSHFPLLE